MPKEPSKFLFYPKRDLMIAAAWLQEEQQQALSAEAPWQRRQHVTISNDP